MYTFSKYSWPTFGVFSAVFIVAALCIPNNVSAQGDLDEIVVTATKREASIQDIGVSVTAFTADSLAANGVSNIGEISTLVPGMNFGHSGNDARPAIRGARTESVNALQDPVIAFYVDGIYRSRTSQALAAITDVERLEVMRGPQGTLSGRNSFGGSINIISKRPDTEEIDYGISGTVGQYSQAGLAGYLNMPVSDNAAFRLTFNVDQHDGKIENLFNKNASLRDKDEEYVRGQLLFTPSEDTELLLRASYWTSDGNGNAAFAHHIGGSPFDSQGRLSSVGTVLPVNMRDGSAGVIEDDDPFTVNMDGPLIQDTEQVTFDVEFNWNLAFADFKVLLGYADFERLLIADDDLTPNPRFLDSQFDDAETSTQEIQLVSNGDGPLQWVLGAYFLQDETTGIFGAGGGFGTLSSAIDYSTTGPFAPLFPFNTSDGQPTDLTNPLSPVPGFASHVATDTDSKAFFGQLTYKISEALSLTGGVRYTEDDKSSESCTNFNNCSVSGTVYDTVLTPCTMSSCSAGPLGFLGGDKTFDKLTWLAELGYHINDDIFLFGRASTGFQSGGFNSSPDPLGEIAFDQQEVDAYEFGAKMTVLDGAGRLNVVVYRNEFSELLGQEFIIVGVTATARSTNAGDAEVTGVEVEFDWAATEAFTLGLRASFSDSELSNFITGAQEAFVDLPRVNGSDPITGTGARFYDASGNPVAMTPDFTVGINASYHIDMGSSGTITPSANIYYSDEYCSNDRCRHFDIQDSYVTADLRLGWESASGNLYAQLFVENVGDEEIINRTVAFSGGVVAQNYADPRTWGLTVGYRYR